MMATTALGTGAALAQSVALEEVVVTAERRSENVQRTPLSITAIDGANVEAAVNRPENLTTLTPSLSISPAGGGMTQIYVRGVGNLGVNAFSEGAVAVNVDQAYVARPTALDGLFYDLERVEVLKGPQGTLYGRNATGGAINVITKKPVLGEYSGSALVEVGNYNQIKVGGAANIPLGETLALRAAFQSVRHDGYLSDGYNDQDTTSARAHLRWEPSSDVSVLLTADYVRTGGRGEASTPSFRTCGDFCGPTHPTSRALAKVGSFGALLLAPGDDGVGFNDSTFLSATGVLDWNLHFANLTVVASHRDVDIDQLIYPNGFRGRVLDQSDQDSIEVRLGSVGDGPLKWVAGIYGFKEQIDGDYAYSHGAGAQVQHIMPNIENREIAAFGQATYSLTDAVRVTAGLRYTSEEKDLSGVLLCTMGFACGGPGGSRILLDNSASWTDTSYRLGLEWDVAPQSMIYASVSTGFKAGGFFPAALNNTFEPEKLTAFAIGAKNRFFANRLQLNGEAFYWTYEDHQESHLGGICFAQVGGVCTVRGNGFPTENVGKSEIKGVDLEATWLVTVNDKIDFSIGYLDAVAETFTFRTPFPPGAIPTVACKVSVSGSQNVYDCAGQDMPRSPKWSGRLSYAHTFPLASGARVVANAGTYFSDSYWGSIDYVPGTRQKAFTTSDAALTYYAPDDAWSVAAWVNNIEDAAIAGSTGLKAFSNTPYENLRPPRTYGLRVTAKFGG